MSRIGGALRSGQVSAQDLAMRSGLVSRKSCLYGKRIYGAAILSITITRGLQDDARAKPQVEPTTDKASFGFAFDCDGVLYGGKQRIDGATHALRALRSINTPYIFLTNGGGDTELHKAKSLSAKLGLRDRDDMMHQWRVIQSHTPLKRWKQEMKENDTVLITGLKPHVAKAVAQYYGFKKVVTPKDIHKKQPSIFPFVTERQARDGNYEAKDHDYEVFTPEDPYTRDIPEKALKIDHIFVFNDPRDWAPDIQLITDLLMSYKGYVGTLSTKNGNERLKNHGYQQDGQPTLTISNVDLVWKTEYPINRHGTGAFVEALKGVWSAMTGGRKLIFQPLGKPYRVTYNYAQDRLRQLAAGPAATLTGIARVKDIAQSNPLKRVYMIGDNPESDIRGANNFEPRGANSGTEWISILVKTGVWQATKQEPVPKYKPRVIVDNVVDAVAWALRNEGLGDEFGKEEIVKMSQAWVELKNGEYEAHQKERKEMEERVERVQKVEELEEVEEVK